MRSPALHNICDKQKFLEVEPPRTGFFDNKGLMTAEDAARELGISKQLVYRLAKLKRLNSVRIGKAVRFRPEDIAEIRHGLRDL